MLSQLETFLHQFTGKTIAVAIHDLETGEEINLHADESFHPASTMKVPVMMEVFRQAHSGAFSLDDRIPINNTFTSIEDGGLFSLELIDDAETTLYPRIGGTESIRELTRLMIVRSSNLATNILLEKVGADRVNTFLQELGVNDVIVIRGVEDKAAFHMGLNNRASARGLTQMMRLIAEGRVISKQASDEMVEILLGQEFNESIPALLPKSIPVAHKTGWISDFYHDTGIVFPENRKPYAITIMTKGFPETDENEAHACMAMISKLVYDQLT